MNELIISQIYLWAEESHRAFSQMHPQKNKRGWWYKKGEERVPCKICQPGQWTNAPFHQSSSRVSSGPAPNHQLATSFSCFNRHRTDTLPQESGCTVAPNLCCDVEGINCLGAPPGSTCLKKGKSGSVCTKVRMACLIRATYHILLSLVNLAHWFGTEKSVFCGKELRGISKRPCVNAKPLCVFTDYSWPAPKKASRT